MNKILRIIKNLTILKGINESELAQRSSVPQSTINSMFQNNNMPSVDTLLKICDGLSIKASEFFTIYENDYILYEETQNLYQRSFTADETIERISNKLILMSDEEKLLIEEVINKMIR